nr:hypothetical protein [Homoserinibacter gongjuensis]
MDGRERHDPRVAEGLGHVGRHERVHRPQEVFAPPVVELETRHVDHVGKLRQRLDFVAVQQVGLDGLDPGLFELLAAALLAEAGHPDDALVRGRALEHAGEAEAHLSGDPEHDDVALELGELPHGVGRRPRHELIEVVERREAPGQRVEGEQLRLCHRSCFRWGVGQASQRSSPAVTKSSSLSSG